MKIEKDSVVGIDYTLTNNSGQVLDTSEGREPLYFIYGKGQIIPGLEEALDGLEKGANLDVTIPPEKAYGPMQEQLIQKVPKDQFPSETPLQVGMQFHAQAPNNQDILIHIKEIEGDVVTVDGNHPLAGETLNFKVDIKDVRAASAEELDHGHVHGPGGVQH